MRYPNAHRPHEAHSRESRKLSSKFYFHCDCASLSQEFALGRALKQTHQRGRTRTVAPSADFGGVPNSLTASTTSASSSTTNSSAAQARAPADGEDLTHFVAAFKEMAANLDEEGARNLLVWSPLFMPTVEGLMRGGAEPGMSRGPKPRLKERQPREACHPAPHPRVLEAQAQRAAHMEKMRSMYAQEAQAAAGLAAAPPPPELPTVTPCTPPQSREQVAATPPARPPGPGPVPVPVPPLPPAPVAPPMETGRAPPPRAAFEEDEWEEEVDDLLDWTNNLDDLARLPD